MLNQYLNNTFQIFIRVIIAHPPPPPPGKKWKCAIADMRKRVLNRILFKLS